MKKYTIKLSQKERIQLQFITRRGKNGVRIIKRANVLLKSNDGKEDKDIAREAGISKRTAQRIRKRYYEEGLERSLYDNPRPGQPPKLDARAEAKLVALACSSPPEGYDYWTLELLQKRLIKDNTLSSISTVAIWYHLKKRGIKPWREKNVVRAHY